ncbi:hypothetical protein E2C01_098788 [Portunus trituberculatus]|uniref:Uncharacterized protein n=1 Tax=Portunus trituberculatus TaxID=210409 RepID=A0A5B7K3T3_PORTR|nr:hypothetical protein [Portunus trituberculatus]
MTSSRCLIDKISLVDKSESFLSRSLIGQRPGVSDEGRRHIIVRDAVGVVAVGAGCPPPRFGCGGRDKY